MVGASKDLAFDVVQNLSALIVDAQEPWGAVKTDILKVLEEGVDKLRVLVHGPPDGVAYAHNP